VCAFVFWPIRRILRWRERRARARQPKPLDVVEL